MKRFGIMGCALLLCASAAPAAELSMTSLIARFEGKMVRISAGDRSDGVYLLSDVGADAFCVNVPATENEKSWTAIWCYPISAVLKVAYVDEPNDTPTVFLATRNR